jgi:hypothetical protein
MKRSLGWEFIAASIFSGTVFGAISLLLSLFFDGTAAYKLRVAAAAIFVVAIAVGCLRWLIWKIGRPS